MNKAEDFMILQGHLYQNNKKKFDNRTLQKREIKKFPLFSEYTSTLLAVVSGDVIIVYINFKMSSTQQFIVIFRSREHVWKFNNETSSVLRKEKSSFFFYFRAAA